MAHSADPSLYEQTIEAQTAIAICSFTRQSETELSFTVNDLLEIWVEDAGSGWSIGINLSSGVDYAEGSLIPRKFWVPYVEPEEALQSTQVLPETLDAQASLSARDSQDYPSLASNQLVEEPTSTSGSALSSVYSDTAPLDGIEEGDGIDNIVDRIHNQDASQAAQDATTQLALQAGNTSAAPLKEIGSLVEQASAISSPTSGDTESRVIDDVEVIQADRSPVISPKDVESMQTALSSISIANKPSASDETEDSDTEPFASFLRPTTSAAGSNILSTSVISDLTLDEHADTKEEPDEKVQSDASRFKSYFGKIAAAAEEGLPITSQGHPTTVLTRAQPHEETPLEGEHRPNLQPLPPTFPRPLSRSPSFENVMSAEEKRKATTQSLANQIKASLKGKHRAINGWQESGAERFVLGLDAGRRESELHTRMYEIDNEPAWSFPAEIRSVSVHKPTKASTDPSTRNSEYISFTVTSSWRRADSEEEDVYQVQRRFSHFSALYTFFKRACPVLVQPALPAKRFLGKFREEFVEERKRDLDRWISRLASHPVFASMPALRSFLCESDENFLQTLAISKEALTRYRPSDFFHQVNHPDFNLDPDQAEDELQRFTDFVSRAQREGMLRKMEEDIGRYRATCRDNASSLDGMAQSLQKLMPLKEAHCWRQDCRECRNVARNLQGTANTISDIATLYDRSLQGPLLALQESAKELVDPAAQYSSLADMQRAALEGLKTIEGFDPIPAHRATASEDGRQKETKAGRCETVLNVAAAELSKAHSDRQADYTNIASSLLDSQIATHQAILDSLDSAKQALETGAWERGRITVQAREEKVRKAIIQPSNYTLGQSQQDILGSTAAAMSERLSSLLRISGLRQAPEKGLS